MLFYVCVCFFVFIYVLCVFLLLCFVLVVFCLFFVLLFVYCVFFLFCCCCCWPGCGLSGFKAQSATSALGQTCCAYTTQRGYCNNAQKIDQKWTSGRAKKERNAKGAGCQRPFHFPISELCSRSEFWYQSSLLNSSSRIAGQRKLGWTSPADFAAMHCFW